MTKKKLMLKLGELVDTVNTLNRSLTLLQKENEELKTEIENLKARPISQTENVKICEIKPACDEAGEGFKVNAEAEENPSVIEPEESDMPERPESEPKTPAVKPDLPREVTLKDPDMEYGSCVIGKIVVESARYADQVSTLSAENKMELLNLIMGKAEVAKAEVFAIATSLTDEETKRELADAQFSEALDYFKSVVGQI